MGKLYKTITPDLRAWLTQQQMFFVASAPLANDGLVNCSPKGMDTFRVLGPTRVAYLDLTGSGIETIAHLRENGRLVFMFCAFSGPPKIVRLHAKGNVVTPDSAEWKALYDAFPDYPGARAIIHAEVFRISDSCGYAVPKYAFVETRDTLLDLSLQKGEAGLQAYRNDKNALSIDGMPGLAPKP